MNNNLTQEDFKNLMGIMSRAQITGNEAMTVALLQQKITALITDSTVPVVEEPTEDN